MLFLQLNDGKTENLGHIFKIELDENKIKYFTAKGSIDYDTETFETNDLAVNRFNELKSKLLVK